VTNDDLQELLKDKSEEWKNGFFAAINLTSESKAAFLKQFIGEKVEVVER
jgi:hypothetical protein